MNVVKHTLILLAACMPSSVYAADRPPNFVVIFTNDQGYADLSCFGGGHVSTPRIDQMAAEGMKLTSFYVATLLCTPDRDNDLKAVRSGKWKLYLAGPSSATGKGQRPALYDLEADIGEKSNVLADHPEVAKRLRSYVKAFEEELARNSRPAGFVKDAKPLTVAQ